MKLSHSAATPPAYSVRKVSNLAWADIDILESGQISNIKNKAITADPMPGIDAPRNSV
jgi:hypothetical protein